MRGQKEGTGPGDTWQIPEIVWGGGVELTGFDDSPRGGQREVKDDSAF